MLSPSPREKPRRLDRSDVRALGFAVEKFVEAFPDVWISVPQGGLIQRSVPDNPESRQAWSNTIRLYLGNRDPGSGKYDPARVGTILRVYGDELAKITNQTNGSNQIRPRQTASERNVERIVANRNLAQRIADGDADEALESIYGGVVDNHRQDSKPRQLAAYDGP